MSGTCELNVKFIYQDINTYNLHNYIKVHKTKTNT